MSDNFCSEKEMLVRFVASFPDTQKDSINFTFEVLLEKDRKSQSEFRVQPFLTAACLQPWVPMEGKSEAFALKLQTNVCACGCHLIKTRTKD